MADAGRGGAGIDRLAIFATLALSIAILIVVVVVRPRPEEPPLAPPEDLAGTWCCLKCERAPDGTVGSGCRSVPRGSPSGSCKPNEVCLLDCPGQTTEIGGTVNCY